MELVFSNNQLATSDLVEGYIIVRSVTLPQCVQAK